MLQIFLKVMNKFESMKSIWIDNGKIEEMMSEKKYYVEPFTSFKFIYVLMH